MVQEIQIEDEKWDRIVKSFERYDIFYLNHYVKAFYKEEDGVPLLIYVENEKCRGINVVMRRDIADDNIFIGKIEKNKYYDIRSPYGYGGFWLEGDKEEFQRIIEEYIEYCLKSEYVCEFVRFELLEPFYKLYYGEVETRSHNIIRSLEMPIEDMLFDFEHKVRKNLKRGIEYGLKIIVDNTGEYLEDFLRIYYGTMKRTGAENNFYFSRSFFETINRMRENIIYFHVVYEDKIISSELVLYGTENAYSYLGGTDSEYFPMRPNDFLKFEAIKWLKEKGLKNFILGGGYGTDDGIFHYKKSFSPNGVVNFYIGKKIFSEKKYQELLQIRKEEKEFNAESSFFPLYRA